MLHPVLEDAIESLLASWRHYENASRRRSEYAALNAARRQLDAHRVKVHRLRRGLHPEPREMESVSLSTHCPSLGVPVFLQADVSDADGSFLCPCGALVTTDAE